MSSCLRFSNLIFLLKRCGKGTFHFSIRFIASNINYKLAKQIEEYVPVNAKWVNCCSSEQWTADGVTVQPQCKWHCHQITDRGNIVREDGSRDITPSIHSTQVVVTDTIGDNIGDDVEPSAKRRGLASAAARDVSPCAATRTALPAGRNPLLMLADVALREEHPLSYEVSNVLAWCICAIPYAWDKNPLRIAMTANWHYVKWNRRCNNSCFLVHCTHAHTHARLLPQQMFIHLIKKLA